MEVRGGRLDCEVTVHPLLLAAVVALTFDDFPARAPYVTERLIAQLRAAHAPAIAFVNESKLEVAGERPLRQWLDAGFELGNHTYSHLSIDNVPFERYRDDLIRGETVTKKLLAERGQRLRYFRHPQLRTGPTPEYKKKLDALLAARGYTVAPVTIDDDDYIFAAAYERAKARGDKATMKEIVAAYVPYLERVTAHFESLARSFLGRELRHVILLHANELNADHLGEVLAMFERRGYRFVSLAEALQDPAYRLSEAPAKTGLSWIHRWMLARGLPMQPEPRPAPRIQALFEASR